MSTSTVSSLVLRIPPPLTEHPASVYLSSLSPGSEPTMKRSLSLIAQLLTNGEADYLTLDWAECLAGHSNPAITARYDRRGEERKRVASAQLGILVRQGRSLPPQASPFSSKKLEPEGDRQKLLLAASDHASYSL
jgi:hypothetical protein